MPISFTARLKLIQIPAQNRPQMEHARGHATATTTIKTESGYRTMPVILQYGSNSNQKGNAIQIQDQVGGIGQHSTNQRGQTYSVVQQQPPLEPQSVSKTLLTQASQQQGGGSTKRIIILQQQQPQTLAQTRTYTQEKSNSFLLHRNELANKCILAFSFRTAITSKKMIMASQQGQQMIVPQVLRQQHAIMNQHSGYEEVEILDPSEFTTEELKKMNYWTNMTPNEKSARKNKRRYRSIRADPVEWEKRKVKIKSYKRKWYNKQKARQKETELETENVIQQNQ